MTTDQATRRGVASSLAPVVASQLLTGTASWSLLIGVLGYATYELHAGPFQAGLLGLAWGTPPVLFGILVGRLIDAYGPKLIVAVSGVGSIAISLWLVFAPGWWLLLALVLLTGVARAFNQPAIDAMPTWLTRPVDHHTSSVWHGFATNVPMVVGPLVAAGMITLAGMPSLYLVNAALHALSLLMLLWVRTRGCVVPVAEGGGRLPRTRGARAVLALSFVVWVSYASYDVLEALYVRDVLSSGVSVFTLLQAAFGVGLLATSVAMTRFSRGLTSYRALAASVVFMGCAEAVYVATDRLWISVCGAVLFGVGVALFGPMCRASLLEAVPPDQHGAAMATWRSAQSAGSVIPLLALGAVGQLLGPQLTMVSTSVMVVTAGLLAWATRRAT
ncbi:MAG: MFS transporter [Micromonosporaceae bacterium]